MKPFNTKQSYLSNNHFRTPVIDQGLEKGKFFRRNKPEAGKTVVLKIVSLTVRDLYLFNGKKIADLLKESGIVKPTHIRPQRAV